MSNDATFLPTTVPGAIAMCGLCLSGAITIGSMASAPDPRAERIAACMTQPGMKYTFSGECLPEDVPSINERREEQQPEINVQGLTQQQIDLLMNTAAEMRAAEVVAELALEYSEYAELGRKIAIAIVEVGDVLGETPESVLESYVGRLILVMVFYKVMGDELRSIGFGVAWFVIFFPLWLIFFRRLVLKERPIVERFDEESKLVERQVMEYGSLDSKTREYLLMMRWMMLAILIVGIGFGAIILS